jgi:hypothetical protein
MARLALAPFVLSLGCVASPPADLHSGASADAGALSKADTATVLPADARGVGTPDAASLPFTPHTPGEAAAQRLSRFIWGQERPPAELVARVEAATTASDHAAIARGMLEDSRAGGGVAAFMRYWLHLDDLFDKKKPPGLLDDQLRQSLHDESIATAQHGILAGDGLLETLLTAPYTFMDQSLARHYGVGSVAGPELRMVAYGTDERIGLFGGAGVLTLAGDNNDPTWPMMRFWYVGEALLCRDQGSGPFVLTGFPVDLTQPMRRQTEERTSGPQCSSCHRYVNPLGYAFLRFDTVGRYRATDADGPIDSSGQIPAEPPPATFLPFPSDLLGLSFRNQPELMRALARLDSVRACFSRQVFNHSIGRKLIDAAPLPPGYDASLTTARDAFQASGGNVRTLWSTIASTPVFRGQ